MKRYLAGAAAVAIMMVGSAYAETFAPPENAIEDTSNSCGFTAKQLAGGFECWVLTREDQVHRTIGSTSNPKCQEGTQMTTTYFAVNKSGNLMDTRSDVTTADFGGTDEPVWEGPPASGACP